MGQLAIEHPLIRATSGKQTLPQAASVVGFAEARSVRKLVKRFEDLDRWFQLPDGLMYKVVEKLYLSKAKWLSTYVPSLHT